MDDLTPPHWDGDHHTDEAKALVEREEQWKPVPGYDGAYWVSDLGRVRSTPRPKTSGGILRQHERYGYLTVALPKELGKHGARLVSVHRIVLSAFVGPCPDGMQTLHINGDRKDNRLENLRWGTAKENRADVVKHGLFDKAMKERRALTDEQAEFVRQNYRKIKQADLAQMLGVHRTTIQRIHAGERYV